MAARARWWRQGVTMSRSSLRHVRRRAQRKLRVGIERRPIDRACERVRQGVIDWLEGNGSAFDAFRAALRSALLELLSPLVRRWLDSMQLGAVAPRPDQQHGDADGAP